MKNKITEIKGFKFFIDSQEYIPILKSKIGILYVSANGQPDNPTMKNKIEQLNFDVVPENKGETIFCDGYEKMHYFQKLDWHNWQILGYQNDIENLSPRMQILAKKSIDLHRKKINELIESRKGQ